MMRTYDIVDFLSQSSKLVHGIRRLEGLLESFHDVMLWGFSVQMYSDIYVQRPINAIPANWYNRSWCNGNQRYENV